MPRFFDKPNRKQNANHPGEHRLAKKVMSLIEVAGKVEHAERLADTRYERAQWLGLGKDRNAAALEELIRIVHKIETYR